MDRESPHSTSDAINLYIRTYYSLLRSSGAVRVRAFEEPHMYSHSSLHEGARDQGPDIAAFAYSAARLPSCMPKVKTLVLGQSLRQFQKAGYPVETWQVVTARGRRRPVRFDGKNCLAVFISSASDIDDLVPIVTAYQIEWNKLGSALGKASDTSAFSKKHLETMFGSYPKESQVVPDAAGDSQSNKGAESNTAERKKDTAKRDTETLLAALGNQWQVCLQSMVASPMDASIRLLNGSFGEYQRSTRRWWQAIDPYYSKVLPLGQNTPVYFVSSNSHSFANLLGGFAKQHEDKLIAFCQQSNPEGLDKELLRLQKKTSESTGEFRNLLYYLLRSYLRHDKKRLDLIQEYDKNSGIVSIQSPGRLDVDAQIITLSAVRADRVDERLVGWDNPVLSDSNAVIINIDYPLGMAAYHHLCELSQGVGDLRGVYVMGKAATLSGRVGDVMVSEVVYDEHSQNTYLFRNQFSAKDIQPYMHRGTVLDNQKAVTVRSAFLQNREYMSVFYREGYTVLEMEAGPYLSSLYELASPKRHPNDKIVRMQNMVDCDIGILHYASDTPYSRRQSLLSKSLSHFGVESTYACGIAILNRIAELEIARLS